MSKEVKLRPVLQDEYSIVRNLAQTIWPICYKDILSIEQINYMLDMMYSIDVISKEASSGVHYYFVEVDSCIAGYVSWGPWENAPSTAKLHKLYLLPEMQGQKLGNKVLDLVKEEVKNFNYCRLRLNVNRENHNAIKCYSNNNFTMVQLENNDIGNNFYMTDYVMESKI
jgi:ribosomal protein S18 acetylase RimI-like enzyme